MFEKRNGQSCFAIMSFAAFGGWSGAVDANADPKVIEASDAVLSYMRQARHSNHDVTQGWSGYNAYRSSQLENIQPWVDAGFGPEFANHDLGAIGASLSSPNMASDLRIPGTRQCTAIVLDRELARYLAGEITAEEAMEDIEEGREEITEDPERDRQRKTYRASLGITDRRARRAGPASTQGRRRREPRTPRAGRAAGSREDPTVSSPQSIESVRDRVAVFVPTMITPIGAGDTFRMKADTTKGPFAPVWQWVGPGDLAWAADPWAARTFIIAADSWQWIPFIFVVLLAALEDVPRDLVEAGSVEGAGDRQIFREITWPQIVPVAGTVMLIRAIEAFELVDLPNTMTAGEPGIAIESMTLHAFFTWRAPDLGRPAAVSYLLLLVTVVLCASFFNLVALRHRQAQA